MAPSKVLSCSHGLALSFEHSQYEQLAERRALRELTNSGSLKKSSFFKKNFVLYPTIILLNGDREILIFSVQLTTSIIRNLTRLILLLLYVMTIHTYIHT